MKLNTTLNVSLKIFFCILFAIHATVNAYSQPGFNFENAVRVSGTDLQVNAKYRFSNITAGTDALVTITQFTGGAYLTELDGTSYGYLKAFQPVVHVPANSNGYVQFKIDFVNTGTTTARSLTQVPITLLDIDAATYNSELIYEFDHIEAYSGYSISHDIPNELNVSVSNGWATGINAPGSEYLGIDTLITKVMFTVENYNISTISIRVGANDPRLAYTVNVSQKAVYKLLGSTNTVYKGNDDAPSNKIYIRMADALLWKAEAYNETGKYPEAIALINKIRERARTGITVDGTLPPAGTLPDRNVFSTDKNQIKSWLMHERRVELGFESHRFNDLKRWKIAKEVLTALGKNFKDFNYYYPIPQGEIDKSGGSITQNSGY